MFHKTQTYVHINENFHCINVSTLMKPTHNTVHCSFVAQSLEETEKSLNPPSFQRTSISASSPIVSSIETIS